MSDADIAAGSDAAPGSAGARARAPRRAFVFAGLAVLALVQLPLIALVFDPLAINRTDPAWLGLRSVLRSLQPAVIFGFAALLILLMPDRRRLAARWREATATDAMTGRALAANLALFALWLGLTKGLNIVAADAPRPPWALFALWTAGVGVLYLLLARAFAPFAFWRRLADDYKWHIALAAGAGLFIQGAALLSQQSWGLLSEATFHLSAFFLGLFESDVVSLPDRRVLGVGDFHVNIAAACSGYEGIGLVVSFLSIYLWMFRKELKFPNAWAILPIGVAAIWILNSVRIAALVGIGAYVSEDMAMTGFHSQAGWMMFLFVTIGLMLASHNIAFFHQNDHAADTAPPPSYGHAVALLAPFLAMTAAGIVAAAFTDGGYWLYALRFVALSAALVWFASYYRRLDWRCGWTPVWLGLLVGAAWIATDPGRNAPDELGAWLAGLTPAAAALWLLMRVIGTAALVPLAEELAFRGYLHRKLVSERFEATAEAAFAWKAFVISSVLFGLLHERWLSGVLAGAVFALALYRSGKLSGAIVAHAVANALIAAWAIGFGQWSLL